MLALLLAADAIPFDSAADTGDASAPAERVAMASREQSATAIGNAIPLGAAVWRQRFDPRNHAKYVADWSEFLGNDKIAAIRGIRMSPAAAALGVAVDEETRFAPVIDATSRQRIRVFFKVAEALQEAAQFDGNGTRLPVSFWIETDAEPPELFEATWVLQVGQA